MSRYVQLSVIQGETFQQDIVLTDADGTALDLTGFSGRGTVKSAAGTTIATLDVIVYDDDAGLVTIGLSAATTAALTAGVYSYDVEVYAGTEQVYKPIHGTFTVISEITT